MAATSSVAGALPVHDPGMPHIHIRDLEEETVAVLRARAATEGLSLAGYLRRALGRLAVAPPGNDRVRWPDHPDPPGGAGRVQLEAAVTALLDMHSASLLGQLVEARVLTGAEADDMFRRWAGHRPEQVSTDSGRA